LRTVLIAVRIVISQRNLFCLTIHRKLYSWTRWQQGFKLLERTQIRT
jgi:hypothetical protein